MSSPFTDDEWRYLCSYRPNGFLRAWNALYATKTRGQRTLGRLTWAALERGNRRPAFAVVRFPGMTGWEVAMPLGFGTLRVWGYRRRRDDED